MTLDPAHPARTFAGEFRLKTRGTPAMTVPVSQTDTLSLIKRLSGGKPTLTLTVGAEYGSGIRLDGELRCDGGPYTLYGSFIDPARPNGAVGTLLILKPRQQVRFRASVTDTGLTLTPAFDDGREHWVQDFYFARHVAAPAPRAPRAPAPPPARRAAPAAPPETPDAIMMTQWTDRLAGTELVYETNAPDYDYSGGSTYYERRIAIKLGASKIFTLDDQSLTRISTRSETRSRPSRTKKVGFWRIAVSTRDQPLLVLKPSDEDEILYVISVRDQTLHLDGKPWALTRP
jgi:hypothetical protein